MAGAYTHMAVVDTAKARFSPASHLGKILREQNHFLTLGSVSPDIPYLSHLAMGGADYANIMHYHSTNGIVHNGMHSLKAEKGKTKPWRAKTAWLAGFVSHLVVDATIHPIVESIVGPYTSPSVPEKHTECEMIQDVMIFHDVKNLELAESEYTVHLDECLVSRYMEEVAHFWAELVVVNCPAGGKPDAEKLTSSYTKELDIASGDMLGKLFRHVGIAPAYDTYDDLTRKKAELVDRYYRNVQLPNGTKGPFREQGFDYAVDNLVAVWSRFERSLFTTDNVPLIIPNWNLDTGVDQDTCLRTYWD